MSCVTWEPKSTMRILSCSASCREAAPDAGEESRSVISKLCAGRARSGQGRWPALSVKQRGENPFPGARLPPGLRGQRRRPGTPDERAGGPGFALALLFAGFARAGLLFRQWHWPAGRDLTGFAGPRFVFAVLFAGFARGVEFHQRHFIAHPDLADLAGRRCGFATLFA